MRELNEVVLIVNPKSTRAKKDLAGKFARDLAGHKHSLRLTVHETKGPGHGEEIAASYAKNKHAVVIAAGGDGSYNEVVNGILQTANEDQPLLGLIPSGNANDHHHAIAKGSIIKHITSGHSRPLDALRVSFTDTKGAHLTRFAHSYIGFGLTSNIRKELDRENVNAFTEKIIAARSFVNSAPIKVRRLSVDLELDSLLFTNINVIAKFFKFSKYTAPDDGKFEVHVLHHSTQLHKAGEIMRLRSKKSTVRSRRTPYAFTALEPLGIQIDGEVQKIAKDSRVVIDLVPKAYRTVL